MVFYLCRDEEDLPHIQPRTGNVLLNVQFLSAGSMKRTWKPQPLKAIEPDNIPVIVLKECADDLARPLAKLFYLCFVNAYQPDS